MMMEGDGNILHSHLDFLHPLRLSSEHHSVQPNIILVLNKLAKLGDTIAISNLKLSITD